MLSKMDNGSMGYDSELVEVSGSEQENEIAAEPPNPDECKLIIEALIFVSPNPVSSSRIAELVGLEQGDVESLIGEIGSRLQSSESGIRLRKLAGGYGFYTCPEAAPFIESFVRSQVNPRLTQASLETLAVVAYLQPVSRGTVATIRGIQSEGVIKTLAERGLVEEAGKSGPPGYSHLYRTTNRFLERFGLEEISDLPPLENFIPDPDTLKRIRESLSWEMIKEGSDIVERIEAGETPEDTGEGGVGVTEEV